MPEITDNRFAIYHIGILALPSVQEDTAKKEQALERIVSLVYSVHSDYPDATIYIHTPNVLTFKPVVTNCFFVKIEPCEDWDILYSVPLQSFHLFGNASDGKEARAIEVMADAIMEKNIYTVSVLL